MYTYIHIYIVYIHIYIHAYIPCHLGSSNFDSNSRHLSSWAFGVLAPQRSMAADAAAGHIQLKVKDQQGSEVQFKIKKSTPLRKLMDAYCSRLGLQASQVRFMVDGERIAPDDTAEKLGLEDEDLIDVAMEQTGGAVRAGVMKAPKNAIKTMKTKKAMRTTKAKKATRLAGVSLSKGGIADALASACELKKADCSKILGALADVGADQVKLAGKFVVPGLVMIKTRKKPATKACKKMMFGKEVAVAAKPAKTVVKAFPVAAVKKAI